MEATPHPSGIEVAQDSFGKSLLQSIPEIALPQTPWKKSKREASKILQQLQKLLRLALC